MMKAQYRSNTYKGEEIEVRFSQWFVWESDDGLGDGYAPCGDIIVDSVKVLGFELPSVPTELRNSIKELASECQGEWEE